MAEEPMCVVMTEALGAVRDEQMTCLSGRDLSNYDYISVRKDSLVSVSVNPISVTRLSYISDQ
jgi:hypothetical protein